MAILSTFRYFIVLFLCYFYFRTSLCEEHNNLSFAFENFGKDSNFKSQLALYGDANVVNGVIQMNGSMGGRILNKKGFKMAEKNPRKMVSFSMDFVFDLFGENGDGFAFVMLPIGYPFNVFDNGSFGLLVDGKMKFLALEFDTFMDKNVNDVNGNHVGVNLSGFVSLKVSNVSKMVLNSGEKLQSWIDYEASSKRLEVRLNKFGTIRPIDPLFSCPIDLSKIWKDKDLFVGLSSSSGNSTKKCNIYSWSFKTRIAPHWMHSEPLDPNAFEGKKQELMEVHSRSDCALRILGALLFGTGCGALGAFIVVIIWTILGSRRPVVPEDHPAVEEHKEFDEYKKFKVVVDKEAIKDGKSDKN